MSRIVVAIPTRDRPEDLRRCIDSLATQTLRPVRVVVSDFSSDERTRVQCELSSEGTGLDIHYLRSPVGGVTVQRNWALDHIGTTPDAVMHCDDDVVLDPNHLQALAGVLDDAGNSDVVGVEGVAEGADQVDWSAFYTAYARIFLLGSHRKLGQLLRSGVNVGPPGSGGVADVEWLYGCAAYRWSAVGDLRFAPELAGYALYEDVAFSQAARARGRLVVQPAATLVHHQSPVSRQALRRTAEMAVANRHWLMARYATWSWRRPFWWSVAGMLLLLVWRGGIRRRPDDIERLQGTLDGVRVVLGLRSRHE